MRYLFLKLKLPRDRENIESTIQNIHSGAVLTSVNLWVLVCAIFIASLGLNTNSTAVIIGAMLISPLMGPIIGFGLGLGISDFQLVQKSIRNFTIMVLMSVATSSVFFLVSPVKEAGSELLGRTSPTLYDVFIAFFGGLAGIIAGSSKLRRSNVIPGVAIATALMPPLCTLGYGISHLNWKYAAGALYLFMINSVFIALATYFIVTLLRYPRVNGDRTPRRKRTNLIISIIVVLMIAPSIYLTYNIINKHFYSKSAARFIAAEIADPEHIVISSSVNYTPTKSTIEVVVLGEVLDSSRKAELQNKLLDYDLKNCELILYQDGETREATRGIFNELNSGIEITRASIKELYISLDSVRRKVAKVAVMDTLQATIGREIMRTDSSLLRITLNRRFSFNPSRNLNDTLWTVVLAFREQLDPVKKAGLESWLRKRLNATYLKLEEE